MAEDKAQAGRYEVQVTCLISRKPDGSVLRALQGQQVELTAEQARHFTANGSVTPVETRGRPRKTEPVETSDE